MWATLGGGEGGAPMPDDEMTTAEKRTLLGECPQREDRKHYVAPGAGRCADCGAPVEDEASPIAD